MEFDGVLERLEAQEAGGPDGEATLGSFRALELPPEPDGAALGRLLEVCLRLMDPREPREGPFRGLPTHPAACAEAAILDGCAIATAGIGGACRDLEEAAARGRTPRGMEWRVPPPVTVPWSAASSQSGACSWTSNVTAQTSIGLPVAPSSEADALVGPTPHQGLGRSSSLRMVLAEGRGLIRRRDAIEGRGPGAARPRRRRPAPQDHARRRPGRRADDPGGGRRASRRFRHHRQFPKLGRARPRHPPDGHLPRPHPVVEGRQGPNRRCLSPEVIVFGVLRGHGGGLWLAAKARPGPGGRDVPDRAGKPVGR